MKWQKISVNSVGRPILLASEREILVEDNIGLYEGKYKAIGYQQGRVYLTTHRICYIDSTNPLSNSVYLRLSDIDRVEHYGGFLKSSAKVIIYLKDGSTEDKSSSGASASWVCPICFYSNDIPVSFELGVSDLPVCLTCGVRAEEKAIRDAVGSTSDPRVSNEANTSSEQLNGVKEPKVKNKCPRCTFVNHPSLHTCEICGGPLPLRTPSAISVERSESPGPEIRSDKQLGSYGMVKLSFRSGGDKRFYEKLLGAVAAAPSDTAIPTSTETPPPISLSQGIHGLQLVHERDRERNSKVLEGALADLETLRQRAKEVIQLAEKYGRYLDHDDSAGGNDQTRKALRHSAQVLGLSTSKETSSSDTVFLSELAREVAQFIQATNALATEGGVITLLDLYAMYNRARGIDLVSPKDFLAACERFDKLALPIKLHKYDRSQVYVIQEAYLTPVVIDKYILQWMQQGRLEWEREIGISAQDASTKFGWSLTVAMQELTGAEQRGTLCRDEQLSGLRFFENQFLTLK